MPYIIWALLFHTLQHDCGTLEIKSYHNLEHVKTHVMQIANDAKSVKAIQFVGIDMSTLSFDDEPTPKFQSNHYYFYLDLHVPISIDIFS